MLSIHRTGTIPAHGYVYVSRDVDRSFLRAVNAGEWVNIFGCRTMGKSSLYAHYLPWLRDNGYLTIGVDIALLRAGDPPPSMFLSDFADAVLTDPALHSVRSSLLGMATKPQRGLALLQFLRQIVKNSTTKVFLAVDEFDSISKLSFCKEIIAAFRYVNERRFEEPDLGRLILAFVGLKPLTKMGDPMDATTSTFATPIETLDFEESTNSTTSLAQAFESDRRPTEGALLRLLRLSGGQPSITMDLLTCARDANARTKSDVEKVGQDQLEKSIRHPDQYLPQFERIDSALLNAEFAFEAVQAYESIIRGDNVHPSSPGAETLRLVGLVKSTTSGLAPKGELFRQRFDIKWTDNIQSRLSARTRQERGLVTVSANGARICIINTGGTIGMLERNEKVVAATTREWKRYFPALDSLVEHFEVENLFEPRDSINVFPDQWVTVANYIYKRREDGFDGFVVCHGTDTLAYTASAVAFALGPNLRFPVVFTGAQTTPDVPFGDAHVNLYRACEVAKKRIPEVVICFGNFVYRAVRAQKKDDRRFEGFESPTYPPLAEITGEINIRSELIRAAPAKKASMVLKADFESSILVVPQYPGLEPSFFDQVLREGKTAAPCKGVIVQTLGAGNVANADPYSFIPFVRRAYRRGIPVIVTSQYPPDPGSATKYTPAQAPIKAGAIHAGNMTQAAAVTKFRWVLAQVLRRSNWEQLPPAAKRKIVEQRMVKQSVVGEF